MLITGLSSIDTMSLHGPVNPSKEGNGFCQSAPSQGDWKGWVDLLTELILLLLYIKYLYILPLYSLLLYISLSYVYSCTFGSYTFSSCTSYTPPPSAPSCTSYTSTRLHPPPLLPPFQGLAGSHSQIFGCKKSPFKRRPMVNTGAPGGVHSALF